VSDFGPVDADLGDVITAWPKLPAPIRAGILAIVRETSG
jgi:hypothetical protein